MVRKKISIFEPIKGKTSVDSKIRHMRKDATMRVQCEIRLCCNCTEGYCSGKPCDKLKEAYKQVKEEWNNKKKERRKQK